MERGNELLIIFDYSFLVFRTKEIVPGAVTTKLPGQCEIIQFGRALQPVYTIALACPSSGNAAHFSYYLVKNNRESIIDSKT